MSIKLSVLRSSSGMYRQICIIMKFYDGSVGDKIAHLRGGKLTVPDVLR